MVKGAVYSDYTIEGFIERTNLVIIMNIHISPGFAKAGTWQDLANIGDGAKPTDDVFCNANGYQLGWSAPTPVACWIDTKGIIRIYPQNSALTNFTISTCWFTAQ